ncbi:MAG: hypothetical protein D8H97_32770, partial [Neisseria sp.]
TPKRHQNETKAKPKRHQSDTFLLHTQKNGRMRSAMAPRRKTSPPTKPESPQKRQRAAEAAQYRFDN